jgi:hypothetical protein
MPRAGRLALDGGRGLPSWVPLSALSPRTVHLIESSMLLIAPSASPLLNAA